MTVIYVDLLVLLNLAVNYLLLRVTARMCGCISGRLRQGISALLGALYGALPFLGIGWASHPICKVCIGIFMSLIAFGVGKHSLRTTLIFFCASAALGGMVLAGELMGGSTLTLENGVLYSWVDIRLLLLILTVSYALLTAVSDRLFVHKARETVPVKVTAGEKSVVLTALLDTGNTLTDPVTNQPVLVVDGSACRDLLPMKVPLERPADALEMLGAAGRREFRLLSYRSVGVQAGMLLALRADSVVVGKKEHNGVLIALSPTAVSDGGGYQALIGGTSWV